MLKNRKKKGFTLVELMVVIAILGILAAALIPRFGGFQDKARSTQALTDAKQIATAMDSLYAEKNAYPAYPEDTEKSTDAVKKADVVSLAGITLDDDHVLTIINANGGFEYKVRVGDKFYSAGRTSGTAKVEAGATSTN